MPAEPEVVLGDEVSEHGDARCYTPLVAWGVVGAAICGAMAPLEPNLLEEGLILHLAERMVGGERLYSELASFTGPLPFELLALLFRLFGEEIAVARAAVAVLAGLSCVSVHALARRAGAGSLAHAAAALVASGPVLLFPLQSTYFYSTIAYHLVLIACYAALRGTRTPGWAWVAGGLVACVALSKQSVGVLIAPGLVAAVFACAPSADRVRLALATALGGLAVTVVTLIYYAAHGELEVLVRSLVVLPLSFEVSFETPFINLWPPGEFAPELKGQAHFYTPFVYSMLRGSVLQPPSWSMTLATQALYALPFVALGATALRRLWGPLPSATWIHAVALLALTSNLFPRTDWGHLVFAAAPAAVQLVLLAPQVRPGLRRAHTGLAALIIGALLCADLYVGSGLWKLSATPMLGPRVPLRPLSGQFEDPSLARVIEYLKDRARPGEAIFVARAEPLIYFATNTRNPTPYSGVIQGMLQEQEQVILAALEKLRFVVMSEIDQPVFTYYRDLLPGVEAYLERHFRVPEEFLGEHYGWIIVLERHRDRGASAIDLFEIQHRGRPWIRDSQGAITPWEGGLPKLATSRNRRPLPLLLGPRGGGIDYEIEVPTGAIFEADIGLAEIYASNARLPRRLTFSVSAARAGDFQPLLSAPVLSRPGDGASWRPIEVDLASYAGERITLRLESSPAAMLRTPRLAWWGSPRLVTRSSEEEE